MKIFSLFFILFFSLSAASASAAGEYRGVLSGFEGNIELHRGGELLEKKGIETGLVFEELDLIKTSSAGYAELTIVSPDNDKLSVILAADSTFYFTASSDASGPTTCLYLLSGEINVTPPEQDDYGRIKLYSRNGITVDTYNTGFEAVVTSDGSFLATSPGGYFTCSIKTGETISAGGGTAAEAVQGRILRAVDAGLENLEIYRNEWVSERFRIFREAPFSLTKPVITEYEEYLDLFNMYYNELKKHDQVFRKYSSTADEVFLSSLEKDIDRVKVPVENITAVIHFFDLLFFHVHELSRYHKKTPIKGTLRRRYEIRDFMKDFEKSYKNTMKKASFAREYIGVYAGMAAAASALSSER